MSKVWVIVKIIYGYFSTTVLTQLDQQFLLKYWFVMKPPSCATFSFKLRGTVNKFPDFFRI